MDGAIAWNSDVIGAAFGVLLCPTHCVLDLGAWRRLAYNAGAVCRVSRATSRVDECDHRVGLGLAFKWERITIVVGALNGGNDVSCLGSHCTAMGAVSVATSLDLLARYAMSDNVELLSVITCPKCGHSEMETMPTDACVGFYPCKSCGTMLRPKQGDCCVFCTYGTVPCPPIQEGDGCCE